MPIIKLIVPIYISCIESQPFCNIFPLNTCYCVSSSYIKAWSVDVPRGNVLISSRKYCLTYEQSLNRKKWLHLVFPAWFQWQNKIRICVTEYTVYDSFLFLIKLADWLTSCENGNIRQDTSLDGDWPLTFKTLTTPNEIVRKQAQLLNWNAPPNNTNHWLEAVTYYRSVM